MYYLPGREARGSRLCLLSMEHSREILDKKSVCFVVCRGISVPIPVEFTYVNQKKMIYNMEITYVNQK